MIKIKFDITKDTVYMDKKKWRYFMLFNKFKPEFFIPLSHANAKHAEKVALRLYNTYQTDGKDVYTQDELNQIIIDESIGLEHTYTIDGLKDAMEKGKWFELLHTHKWTDDYCFSDLFVFCEAMLSIKPEQSDMDNYDSITDIRLILKKINDENSFDSINSIMLLVTEYDSKIKKIRSRIYKKMRDIKNATSDSEAIKECLNPDFENIFRHDIGITSSLKTDPNTFLGFFRDILDIWNDESKEKILQIAKNAGDRNTNDIDMEAHIRDQFFKIQTMLERSKNIRDQIENSIKQITEEAMRRHRSLLSFKSSFSIINYDIILKNIDNSEEDYLETTISRTNLVNPEEPMRIPDKPRERIKATSLQIVDDTPIVESEYDKAKKMSIDEAKKIISENKYERLSDIKIENIYDIMLFQLAEKISLELHGEEEEIVNNDYFTFHDRRII